jgi:hypothetical protein
VLQKHMKKSTEHQGEEKITWSFNWSKSVFPMRPGPTRPTAKGVFER